MSKLKYILILLVFFTPTTEVKALDIQYGSIKGYKGSSVLIEYYGIGEKNNYICNISNYKCTPTKKTSLGTINTLSLKNSIKKELKEKGASHITLSKNSNWLAYYIGAKDPDYNRSYVIKNIKENKNYIISDTRSYWDLIDESKSVFEFSSDEKILIYLDDKDGFTSLYKINLDSISENNTHGTKIQTPTYTIGNFIFFDSQNIYYVGNTEENPYIWSLYHLDIKTGKNTIVESNVSYLDKIFKIGSSIIFNHLQEKGYGPEIYNTKTKKINNFKIPNINNKSIINNEEYVKVGNSNAIIMTPLTYESTKKYPSIIWLHGGPLRQTSLGYHPYRSYGIYDSILKSLQKNNVIILKLDYRGSFGNGRIYSESIKGNVGKGDIDDVMEAVTYLKNQYNIKDIYLAGNSYGGYMSLKALVDHPEAFKGIFSINGVTDWESLMISMKDSIFNTQFYGLPNDYNKQFYEQASIINKIQNLGDQRIELIQGEADRTIPLWQSIFLSNKLKESDKNVNLVTYKNEDHVFKEKNNIEDICIRLFGLIEIKDSKDCKY